MSPELQAKIDEFNAGQQFARELLRSICDDLRAMPSYHRIEFSNISVLDGNWLKWSGVPANAATAEKRLSDLLPTITKAE